MEGVCVCVWVLKYFQVFFFSNLIHIFTQAWDFVLVHRRVAPLRAVELVPLLYGHLSSGYSVLLLLNVLALPGNTTENDIFVWFGWRIGIVFLWHKIPNPCLFSTPNGHWICVPNKRDRYVKINWVSRMFFIKLISFNGWY